MVEFTWCYRSLLKSPGLCSPILILRHFAVLFVRFSNHLAALDLTFCNCTTRIYMYWQDVSVHGRSKWLGWSGFGPTTFSQTKRHMHISNARELVCIRTSKPSRLGKWLPVIVQISLTKRKQCVRIFSYFSSFLIATKPILPVVGVRN